MWIIALVCVAVILLFVASQAFKRKSGATSFAITVVSMGVTPRANKSPSDTPKTFSDLGPSIDFFHRMLSTALQNNINDVELIPYHDRAQIHFLIGDEWEEFDLFVEDHQFYVALIAAGVLTKSGEAWYLAREHHALIVERLKMMAKIDESNQNYPLSGKTCVTAGRKAWDLKVTILQGEHGEFVNIAAGEARWDIPEWSRP